jgi:hypothetical protein
MIKELLVSPVTLKAVLFLLTLRYYIKLKTKLHLEKMSVQMRPPNQARVQRTDK